MSQSFRLKLNNQKDIVTIFKDFGNSAKSLFKKKEESRPIENDGFSFGVVYANDFAKAEIEKTKPKFLEGSIIVREKLAKPDDSTPQIIIAMVKREKGFSKKTNDWEFFTFNGADLKLQKRQTKSDCSKCHSQAKETDFVFKTYLK